MIRKKPDLETLVNNRDFACFKSNGERKIAKFFDEIKIKYEYEAGTLVSDGHQKQRLWYLDFYLPEFGMYVEYFGILNSPDYDKGIRAKRKVYSKMRMDVIEIYPQMFAENWKGYIINKIGERVQRQYDRLVSMNDNYLRHREY
jgi:hypothetical protein